MRPTKADWLTAIDGAVHRRSALPLLGDAAAEFCLAHPELIEAIETLLANANDERLSPAREAKQINSKVRRWLVRGIWPLVKAELTANGRTTTKEEIRIAIISRMKDCGYKIEDRAVREYTKGLG